MPSLALVANHAAKEAGLPMDTNHDQHHSPLPQSQWSEVPLPYRPRDWVDESDRLQPYNSQQERDWRLRPAVSNDRQAQPGAPTPLKTRRRPQSQLELPNHNDPSLLQPEISARADRFRGYQTRRAVSQPNSPPSFQQQFAEAEPPMLGIPRSPTYPPAGRRRMHSTSGVTDAAFDDEAEFRLFVDATAGLGPHTAFRPSVSTLGISRSRAHDQSASPIASSPSTMLALAHLAQMPQAGRTFESHPRQVLQAVNAGVDLWSEPPTRSQPAMPLSPLDGDEEDDDDLPPPDDELPNYAESQAQAQAGQRAEAARRAQELQRRWQARS
ncbi:hypothetical protein LTS14_008167 [Recurvomyces mirabilis]|uniref:uncharacterized protein n=1 Tax=Recurvomyces mirabilis TaxID=574656 RepID=UPI002DDECFAF|nr:hypothetical protein LTS14_008167 [Recurvomyces mirabilis]